MASAALVTKKQSLYARLQGMGRGLGKDWSFPREDESPAAAAAAGHTDEEKIQLGIKGIKLQEQYGYCIPQSTYAASHKNPLAKTDDAEDADDETDLQSEFDAYPKNYAGEDIRMKTNKFNRSCMWIPPRSRSPTGQATTDAGVYVDSPPWSEEEYPSPDEDKSSSTSTTTEEDEEESDYVEYKEEDEYEQDSEEDEEFSPEQDEQKPLTLKEFFAMI